MSIADPNKNDPNGREPIYTLEPEGRRAELDRGELLADHLFASWSRPRPLLEKRADGTALVHLLQQSHCDGAVAAVNRTRYAQCKFPTQRSPVRTRNSPKLEIHATSGSSTHPVAPGEEISLTWVRYRRAATHPLAAEPNSRPALRRVHRADPSAGPPFSSATASRRRGDPGRGNARGGHSQRRRWHSRKAGRKRSEAEPPISLRLLPKYASAGTCRIDEKGAPYRRLRVMILVRPPFDVCFGT